MYFLMRTVCFGQQVTGDAAEMHSACSAALETQHFLLKTLKVLQKHSVLHCITFFFLKCMFFF